MKKLLEEIQTIREKAAVYGDRLEKINPKVPNSFNMIFNYTTLTLELLSYYFQVWGDPHPLPIGDIERLKKENAERVLEITKWAFISALSEIEYSAKETLKMIDNKSFEELKRDLQTGKRVYLRRIMRRSKEVGLIEEEQYQIWSVIIEVRNVVVHNNAIADNNKEYEINGMKVTFVKEKMLKGKLNFFIKLLEAAIDQYYQWLQALFKEQSQILQD